jgi:lariat debranching enzyme
MSSRPLRIAVEGCGHGTLHAIYASIAESCKRKGWSPSSIDLLIIGGDFQAVRNASDLHCVSMPEKYREMHDFHEYYSGARVAPYLTIFVGGNHEASNYLQELYFGGWVAPRMYYMGAANVLRLTRPTAEGDGAEKTTMLRIAGMSGIWKGFDYRKPHVERMPYSESDLRSVYHVREMDVRKLLQVNTQVDVGISHDWPQGVEWLGNVERLFTEKPFFRQDAQDGRLGSVAAKEVLEFLRPRYWFSAHLHVKYAALVHHGEQDRDMPNKGAFSQTGNSASRVGQIPRNDDEIDLDIEDALSNTAPDGSSESNRLSASQVQQVSRNDDEIDLDMEDEGTTPSVEPQASEANADEINASSNAVPGVNSKSNSLSARDALPAAFRRVPISRPLPPITQPPAIANKTTHFLSLDKCLRDRDFLQLLEIDPKCASSGNVPPAEDITSGDPVDQQEDELSRPPVILSYDREWLAITRAFALAEPPVFGTPSPPSRALPVPGAKPREEYRRLIGEAIDWVDANVTNLEIPENFTAVAPVYDGGDFRAPKYRPGGHGSEGSNGEGLLLREYPNPQTAAFCRMLDFPNPLEMPDEEAMERMRKGPRLDGSQHGGPGGPGGRRGGGGGRGRGRGRGRRW